MSGKKLIVLVIACAVLVGLAVRTSKKSEFATPEDLGKPIFKGLDLNKVEKVVLRESTNTITLTRTEKGWVSADKSNYPADFNKIRAGLLKLSELKIGQIVRIDERQKAELKMLPPTAQAKKAEGDAAAAAAPKAADPSGKMIELFDKGGAKLASLLVGETRKSRPSADSGNPFGMAPSAGQYVSTDEGKTVYLVSEALQEFPSEVNQWLDAELLNVEADKIKNVSVTGPNRMPLTLIADANGALQLPDLPPNEQMNAGKASRIKSALSYLRFEDVANPALAENEVGMADPTVFIAETKEGALYTVRIGSQSPDGSGRYLRLSAEMTSEVPPPPPPVAPISTNVADVAAAEEATRKAAEAQTKQRDELARSVKELNEKLKGWTFVIPSYKAEAFLMQRTELSELKKTDAAKPAEAQAPQMNAVSMPLDMSAPPAPPINMEAAPAPAPEAAPVSMTPPPVPAIEAAPALPPANEGIAESQALPMPPVPADNSAVPAAPAAPADTKETQKP